MYMLEFSKIHKVGGISSPYASIEWPYVQIPEAFKAILKEIGLNIFLLNNDEFLDTTHAYFFERNPAVRELEFDEFLEHKAAFLRYAVQLNSINPIRDITKNPLPPLEEIVKGVSIRLRDVVVKGTQSKKYLERAFKEDGTEIDWFLDNSSDCEHSLELKKHLGAEGAMSPGRVQYPEGAKTIVLSYNAATGATATITKHRFIITCYTETETRRMRLDPSLTLGRTVGAQPRT
jgi:hypothetical protein